MRPSYVELPLLDAPSTPRAALYRYLEGHRLPQGRVAAPGPCSLAVLFVLGNASHEQVRSIASVTLRSPRGDDLHFYARAVGAVHTAMDGADLLDQAAHVERALRALAQLYRDTPAQLALLAHSMGGIAALHALGPLQAAASGGGGGGLGMAAAASAWRSRRSCASARRPRRPSLHASRSVETVYAETRRFWGAAAATDATPAFVSLCGGRADWQVSPALCGLRGLVPDASRALSADATRQRVGPGYSAERVCHELPLVLYVICLQN